MSKERIVVDSSVIVKWLSEQDEKHLKQADTLLADVQDEKVELYSPELAKYEVGNVMLKKGASLVQTKTGTATIYKLPIQFIREDQELCERTTELAYDHGITYYDASFIALAETLKSILVTDNIKHQGKVTTPKVIPIASYKSKQ